LSPTLERARRICKVHIKASIADCIPEPQRLFAQAKDFEEADAVRARLDAVGIMIMDGPAGTTWRPGVQQIDA